MYWSHLHTASDTRTTPCVQAFHDLGIPWFQRSIWLWRPICTAKLACSTGRTTKVCDIIPFLYTQTKSQVRVNGELSKSFPTRSGVRQGCPLSPFLFNFVIDEIMKRELDGLQNPGVRIMTGENLVDLEYADNIVLLFEKLQQAQSVLDYFTKVIYPFVCALRQPSAKLCS